MVRRRERAGGPHTAKKEVVAVVAVAPAQTKPDRSRRPRPPKAVFATAQRRNKGSLGMGSVICEADAYVSMGRILDEVSDRVVQRCVDMGEPSSSSSSSSSSTRKGRGQGDPVLQPLLMATAIASFVPDEKRDEVRQWVNKTLDAYFSSRDGVLVAVEKEESSSSS